MARRYEAPFVGRDPGEEPSDEALLQAIGKEADIPASISVEAATEAALSALAEQLTGGEARDLVDQLPPRLAASVRPYAQHGERPVAQGRDAFLARAGERLGLDDTGEIAAVCRGVFAAVREHVSARDMRGIYSQLSEDLRGLWGPS